VSDDTGTGRQVGAYLPVSVLAPAAQATAIGSASAAFAEVITDPQRLAVRVERRRQLMGYPW